MTDMMIQTPQGEMEMRLQEQEAVFVKKRTGEEPIRHRSRIITYVDVPKRKFIGFLSDDLESD